MMKNINFLSFRESFVKFGCISINQIMMLYPNFDTNNLTRWTKQRLLLRLRRGWYAFPEQLKVPDFAEYVANRIYRPSYISLHTALSFYGVIPEAVTDVTSVTTLKTASFTNEFGKYSYRTVQPKLFFGFDMKPMSDGRTVQIATPEKAMLDLLYLYPIYNSEEDMLELRLDEAFMEDEFDRAKADAYLKNIGNKALNDRTQTLYKAYGL